MYTPEEDEEESEPKQVSLELIPVELPEPVLGTGLGNRLHKLRLVYDCYNLGTVHAPELDSNGELLPFCEYPMHDDPKCEGCHLQRKWP